MFKRDDFCKIVKFEKLKAYQCVFSVMTPSGKKVNLITANKVTSISPRRGGKIQEPKKETFSQKKFNGKVDYAFWFMII